MPKFSEKSLDKLSTAHPKLQQLFNEVIKHYDCTILEGHRDKALQDAAYLSGRSKVQWPNGKHNKIPSLAVDVAPYPVNWSNDRKNIARFYHFGGFVEAVAKLLNIQIRLGLDWDRDHSFSDQTFDDCPHFELIGEN